ncbi:hypothetical protein F180042I2_33910 [Enterocloster bolteae]
MAAAGPLDACPHIDLWYVDLPRPPLVGSTPRIRIANVTDWLDMKFSMCTCKGLIK